MSHVWINHIMYKWVILHIKVSYVKHMNESCHTYEEVISHMNESCHTHKWVMSHIWMSYVTYELFMSHTWRSPATHMKASCHTYKWVKSHMRMIHATNTNESCRTYEWGIHTYEWVLSHIWTSHVTRMNESHHLDNHSWIKASNRKAMLHQHFYVFSTPICAMTHSFICVTCLILQTRSMTHSRCCTSISASSSRFCAKWLIHSYVCHDSFIHMCAMTPSSYTFHDSFTLLHKYLCVIFALMCEVAHSYVCHDSFIHMCDMTHSSYTRLIYIVCTSISASSSRLCANWIIPMCAMTHSFICVTWLIQIVAQVSLRHLRAYVRRDTFLCAACLCHMCDMSVYEWVMPYMNEPCHYEWDMSHIWMRHVTHVNE